MRLDLQLAVPTSVEPTARVLEVASMFGLGLDGERLMEVVPPVGLEVCGGQVVFITGPSGGGKSTLLRLIGQAVQDRGGAGLVRFDQMSALAGLTVVDCIGSALPEAGMDELLTILSLAGLNDAFVMLRRPGELSDGQRYRLRLALAIAAVRGGGGGLTVVLADEFGSMLDRVTAGVIARNVRKWTRRDTDVCFIAATAHDDLLEPLEPDVLIEKGLGDHLEMVTRGA